MVGRRGGPRREDTGRRGHRAGLQQDAPYSRLGTYMSNTASKSNASERRACPFAPMHRTFVQKDAAGGNARYVRADTNLEEVSGRRGKDGLLPRGPCVRAARVPPGTATPTPLPRSVDFSLPDRLPNLPALGGPLHGPAQKISRSESVLRRWKYLESR